MRAALPAALALTALLAAGCGDGSGDAACRALSTPSPADMAAGMVWVPGGTFRMGDDAGYPEEAPARLARVEGFWISATEVTNAEFAAFVAATGYVTEAERGGGGLVFASPDHPRRPWWRLDAAATWRQPAGAGTSLAGRAAHPVVQVTFADALAYARWRGHDLPEEAEWEFAARGGLTGARYAWGETLRPDGVTMANTWQGPFPVEDTAEDGYAGTAPVGCFPPNSYGLFDMAGNVWEWTRDSYRGPAGPDAPHEARVIKGGSYLCAPETCARYRPAARQPGDATLGTSHTGFRTVWRGPPPAPADRLSRTGP